MMVLLPGCPCCGSGTCDCCDDGASQLVVSLTPGEGTGEMVRHEWSGTLSGPITYTLDTNSPTAVSATASIANSGCLANVSLSKHVGEQVTQSVTTFLGTDTTVFTSPTDGYFETQSIAVSAAMCGKFMAREFFWSGKYSEPILFEDEAAWVSEELLWVSPTNYLNVAAAHRVTFRYRWLPFRSRIPPTVEFLIFGSGTGSGAAFSPVWRQRADVIGNPYWELVGVTVDSPGAGYPTSGMELLIRITNGRTIRITNDGAGIDYWLNPPSPLGQAFAASGSSTLPFTLASSLSPPTIIASIPSGASHTREAVFSVSFTMIPGTTAYEISAIDIIDGGAYWTGFTTLPINLAPAAPSTWGDVIFFPGSIVANLTAGVVTSVTLPGYRGVFLGASLGGFATIDHTAVGTVRWTGLTGVVVDRTRSAPALTATVGGETLTVSLEYVADGEESYWRLGTLSTPTGPIADGTSVTITPSPDSIEEVAAVATTGGSITNRGKYYKQTYTSTETPLPTLACKDFPSGWKEKTAVFHQTAGGRGDGPTQGESQTVSQIVSGWAESFTVTRRAGEPTIAISIE